MSIDSTGILLQKLLARILHWMPEMHPGTFQIDLCAERAYT